MAGSYGHVTNNEAGQLLSNQDVADMLENGGDVYEAVRQMYGMIWYLADGSWNNVEQARMNYKTGLEMSPGVLGDDD